MTGTAKLDSWEPQEKPDRQMLKTLRQYVVEAVFAKYQKDQTPATLLNIFYRVNSKIKDEIATGRWEWKRPGKRTIDRRVNEAADPRFYLDGVPKIVAVTAGVYQPNPELFGEGETKTP